MLFHRPKEVSGGSGFGTGLLGEYVADFNVHILHMHLKIVLLVLPKVD